MNKIIVLAAFLLTVLFGVMAAKVNAQTTAPTASPRATTVPSGAPQTGFGGFR